MNKEIKEILKNELTSIPNFIDPKNENHNICFNLLHHINSSTFYALDVCCRNKIFLDTEYLSELSFDISVELNEVREFSDTNLMLDYYNHITTFIKYLEQMCNHLELFECSHNLKELYKYLVGENLLNNDDL